MINVSKRTNITTDGIYEFQLNLKCLIGFYFFCFRLMKQQTITNNCQYYK